MLEIGFVASLSLAALGPPEPRRAADPHAQCGYHHRVSIDEARGARDHETVSDHLARLNRLAGALATRTGVSRDGAHAILRRTGARVRSARGDGLVSVAEAREACAALESSLFPSG